MLMSMSTSKLTVISLTLQIWKIRMTKKINFVSGVGIFFIFYFLIDDLAFNDMTFLLSVNMDIDVSIEIHGIWQTIIFLTKKWKINLFKIRAKLNDHILKIRNSKTKFKWNKNIRSYCNGWSYYLWNALWWTLKAFREWYDHPQYINRGGLTTHYFSSLF
jgi:hypothetical protein